MNAKTLIGLLFFLVDLIVIALGGFCLYAGMQSLAANSGEGNIKVVVTKLGEISGINGSTLIFVAGVAMILSALAYARKAYLEAMRTEQGIKDTVRHFAPL